MGRRPAAKAQGALPEARARMVPTQKRSRERFERILHCAEEVMAEKGSEAFRMSDIVERTGIPFGSLYQYFPDKTAIIGTLAERCNATGRACVARDLETVRTLADLHPALGRIVDSYYGMFMDEPVMRDIWQATQADRALQRLDEADGAFLARLLADAVRPIAGDTSPAAIESYAQLVMTLIASAVRHAIPLPPAEARRLLALFKRMLPADLAALDAQ